MLSGYQTPPDIGMKNVVHKGVPLLRRGRALAV